jgi:hypothetical protein
MGLPLGFSRGVASTNIDSKVVLGRANIPLADDGSAHLVLIVLGEASQIARLCASVA